MTAAMFAEFRHAPPHVVCHLQTWVSIAVKEWLCWVLGHFFSRIYGHGIIHILLSHTARLGNDKEYFDVSRGCW